MNPDVLSRGLTEYLQGGTGAFCYAALLLTQNSAELGPDPMIIWVSLVYSMLAVGLALVGRVSDIFGRRYFFIGGTSSSFRRNYEEPMLTSDSSSHRRRWLHRMCKGELRSYDNQ